MQNNRFFRLLALSLVAAAGCFTSDISAFSAMSFDSDILSPLPTGYFERARQLSNSGNYAGVIDQLDVILCQGDRLDYARSQELLFLLGEAYYQRGDERCVGLLQKYASQYPAASQALEAAALEADFYFFAHDWKQALLRYNELDIARLDNEKKPLYTYRRSLSLIKCGFYDEALPLVEGLIKYPGYSDPSYFYQGYIYYMKGDYDKSYSLFSKVAQGAEEAASTAVNMRRKNAYVPSGLEAGYYMTQIDYQRGRYEEVVKNATSLMKKMPVEQLMPEMMKITGLSYFKLDDYSRARDYLQQYFDSIKSAPTSDALYALGVLDYRDGDYTGAREKMMQLTDLNDEIAQSAWLYLGQCAVKEKNNSEAAIDFEKAAKMNYDKKVGETALYNYVAAVTRGGNIPFSSSVSLLEKFIENYPQSEYAPAVEEYLAIEYYNGKDYQKALRSISAIKNPSKKVLEAKQKIVYELGVEALSNNRPAEAEQYLLQAASPSGADDISTEATLWLGDARYALGKFAEARKSYTTYIENSKKSDNRTLALYNLAYTYYMQDDYRAALKAFDNAIASTPGLPSRLKDDANVRLADCRYYSGDYKGALPLYRAVSQNGGADADYAAYRTAVMEGLGGNVKKKLSLLADMQSRFPNSKWLPQAMMETGLTYEALGETAKAAEAFSRVARDYPESAEARRASLSMALAYMHAGEKGKAIETYKEILRKWPSSEEASMANDDLKAYYASIGQLREYADFLKTVPGCRQLDASEMEQLEFEGAEAAFAENSAAISLLKKFVENYPDGKYLASALLDLAIAYRDEDRLQDALETLNTLISRRPHSPQYPEALLLKGEILEDRGATYRSEALEAYRLLDKSGGTDFAPEAWSGIMRCSDDPREILEYARKCSGAGGLDAADVEEASLYEASALMSLGDTDKAVEILTKLSQNPATEAGAKGAVALANHYLSTEQYNKAEKVLTDFAETGTPHQYQLALGFIALADTYHAQGKTYLAKEYLQSLRDNYPGDETDIFEAISSRLKKWK